jgi:O-antigen/teichoic acid export membrane protein
MFGPFVADLHHRGETQRLDRLFKSLTRWIVAATLPLFILIAVAPGRVLTIFGSEFAGGRTALLILLAGQFVNIATGSAGFILIMVGRTGWDLAVYAGSLLLDLVLAFWLASRYGMTGAALANAITFSCSNVARLALVKRFVGIQPYDRHYLRLVGPGAVGAVVMAVVHSSLSARGWLVDVVVTGIAGGVAYAAAYAAVGLTPAERRGAAGLAGRLSIPLLKGR